jgi:gas vesicle protein
MGFLILGLVVGAIIGFVAGMLVWRNNAKKFSKIEADAKAKGKSVDDWVKGFLV